jgi:tyrosine-protein kinase Etk/Wzc
MIQVEAEQPRFILATESPLTEDRLVNQVPSEIEILRSRLVLDPVVRELGLDAVVQNPKLGQRLYVKEFHADGHDVDTKEDYRVEFKTKNTYDAYNDDDVKLGTGDLGVPFTGGGVRWVLEAQGVNAGDSITFEKVPFEQAVSDLQEILAVEEVGKETNLLSVAVDMPDAGQARETIQKLTEAYLAQNIERKSREASQTLAFLEDQLLFVQGNMEHSEKELNAIKSSRGIFTLSEDAKRIIDQISKLELNKMDLQLRQSQMDQISASLQKGSSEAFLLGDGSVTDTLISALAQSLSEKLVEMRSLRQNATERHPRVIALESEIQELKGKIQSAVNNSRGTIKSQMATTENLLAKYDAQLKDLPNAEREMAALTRKSEVNGDLYSFLLKKHEEARIAQAGIVGNIRIVESASVPIKPASPKKLRDLAIALVGGLLLGAALAFGVEYTDDTINTTEEVESRFGLGVYGEIPVFPDRLKDVAGGDNGGFLTHRADPRSSVHEAFRSLATNIRFAGAHSGIKRISCTSTELGEGKTTVIVNLAVTLAERGSRVLLIDCDLRRPRIHDLFKLNQQPGLTNAILGEMPWKEAVRRSGVERLGVIAAGATPPNQAELLDSAAFGQILEEAGQNFDYVLIDVPPVIAFTDAAIVSTRVDAMFMIVAASQTRMPAFRRSLEILRNVHAPVRGTIFTRSKLARGSEEYYRAQEQSDKLRTYGQRIRNLLLRT